ncbi:MAG: hypothetical protein ACMUIE_04825 [Thermoplasmatota archaeon]
MDPGYPPIESVCPSDWEWTAEAAASFSWSFAGDEEGFIAQELLILGDDLRIIYSASIMNFTGGDCFHRLTDPLEDGLYLWMINLTDEGNNTSQLGPWHFFIDTVPPDPVRVHFSMLDQFGELEVQISSGDEDSKLSGYLIQRMEYVNDSFTPILDVRINGSDNERTMLMMGSITHPAFYWRGAAVDKAGNIGPWSSVIRTDPPVNWTEARSVSGIYVGPNRSLEAVLRDPLGIDLASLEYSMSRNDPEAAWTHLSTYSVIESDSPSLVYSEKGAVSIRADLGFGNGSMNRDARFRWRDLAPLAVVKETDPIPLIYLGSPPEIELRGPDIVQTTDLKLSLISSHPHPGAYHYPLWARRSGENWTSLDELNYIVDGYWDGWRYDIGFEIEMGTTETYQLMVMDHAGNLCYAEHAVRATRPPLVRIIGLEGSDEYAPGSLLELKAEASDPDGDPMDLQWLVNGEQRWTGQSFSLIVQEGKYDISVIVSDGALFDNDTATVSVREDLPSGSGEREFPAGSLILISAVLMILLVAAGLFLRAYRARRDPVHTVHARPKVRVWRSRTDAGKEKKTCVHCLEEMKESREIKECGCGSMIHTDCAMKCGSCPSCGRELLITNVK